MPKGHKSFISYTAPHQEALIRHTASKFTALFDEVFKAGGIRVLLTAPQAPRINMHRPHRALNQASSLRALPDPVDADNKVIRRHRHGGLLHEYTQVR
ncbi:MAG: hypothetical protein JWP48_5923 [Actinoallomurus sp.]|jgi:putative transposase|nr:hypothetical protein [Actinoallomurus sp.]